MKLWLYFLLWISLNAKAVSCFTENLFFSAYTDDNKRYVEVCLYEKSLYFQVSQNETVQYRLIQPLSDVTIQTWVNNIELIVTNANNTLAVIDNGDRISLLTLDKEKNTGYFSNIPQTTLSVNRLYALKELKKHWSEEEWLPYPPLYPLIQ